MTAFSYPRPQKVLEAGGGLRMELVTLDDKALWYDAVSDNIPHLSRDSDWAAQVTPASAAEMVDRLVANSEAGVSAPYKLIDSSRQPNEFVGALNLFRRDGPTIGVGFWLIESAQHRGIIWRAGSCAVNSAFNDLGVDIVWAEANRNNKPSIKALQRIGLSEATDQTSRDSEYKDTDKIIFEVHRNGR